MSSARTSVDRPIMLGTVILDRSISLSQTLQQPPLRLAYRIIRPSLLKSEHAPLLFIHGGPSLASEYLNPIVDEPLLQDRSIILYDQLGCGWSSIPTHGGWYGVENMALDLRVLLKCLKEKHNLTRYHMCCHSLGGSIGYEMLRTLQAEDFNMPQCLSFILSNAATNFVLSDSERRRLFVQLGDTQSAFFKTHICRCKETPNALQLALTRRGKAWSANSYVALPVERIADTFPPTLIIRGEYDFVTEICTSGWTDLIGKRLAEVVMSDCAHYPHLEEPAAYCEQLRQFCTYNEQTLKAEIKYK